MQMGRCVSQIFTNISFKLFCCYYSYTEEKETVKSPWSRREGSEATHFEPRAQVFKHYAIASLSCQGALLSNVLIPQVTFLIFQVLSSVAQSCRTLCDPMNCSTPGLPVHHQLPELTQTHVHWVSDAIQPSHPLSSPSPPAFNLSQPQGLFKWVSSSHQIAKVLVSASATILPMNIQDWFPGLTGWISLQFKGLSRVFSNTTVQKSQFFSAQLSLWSNSHVHTWLQEKS